MSQQEEQQLGYAEPLFQDAKPVFQDDFFGPGMKMTANQTGYHDRHTTLKIARGLCHDILFRAEDVNHPDYDKIPELDAEPEESDKKVKISQRMLDFVNGRKPLDTRSINRTYLLDPSQKEERPRKSRPGRGPKKNKAQKRRRRRR